MPDMHMALRQTFHIDQTRQYKKAAATMLVASLRLVNRLDYWRRPVVMKEHYIREVNLCEVESREW
jgi:hypothetical protein